MGRSKQNTLYIVAYDIPDDRRRTKVHKTLLGFGEWTQYSLFECYLTAKELVVMVEKLNRILDPSEDSLRIYPLCEACERKVKTIGSEKPAPKDVFIP